MKSHKEFRITPTSQISDRPLFTVVTAVFNGAMHLESTILSVLNQGCSDFEYIVIDGESTDGTLNIISKYEHLIDYWVSERDRGVYDAFNKACRVLRGEWVIFLGAGDTFYGTDVLSSMSEKLRLVSAETEIVYGRVLFAKSAMEPSEIENRPWNEMRNRWMGGRPMLPHHQGVFHRRRILSSDEPFDTSYKIAADSKLLYKSIGISEPLFVDLIVTVAPLGGISSDPEHFMVLTNEIIRVNREFGFSKFRHQLWCYLKAISKLLLFRLAGNSASKFIVDGYRRLTGRKGLWRDKEGKSPI